MFIDSRNARRLSSLFIIILLLSCSNEGYLNDSSRPDLTVSPEDHARLLVSDEKNYEHQLNTHLNASVDFRDRDNDGIHDDVDLYPDIAPSFRDTSSSHELSIERVWTEIGSNIVLNSAIENRILKVSGTGFSEAQSNSDVWLVFMTENGLRAEAALLGEDGSLSALPPLGTLSVHVVIGLSRSLETNLDYQVSSAPVIYHSDSAYKARESIVLIGKNLGAVNKAMLGSISIDVVEATENSVSLALPATTSSNQLRLFSDKFKSNQISLNLIQDVRLIISDDLGLKSNDVLSLWFAGERYQFSANNNLSISVPAYKPVILYFDVLNSFLNMRYANRVSAVAWPGDKVIEISPESTLLSRFVNMRRKLPATNGENWVVIRDQLTQVINTHSAETFLNGLKKLLADNIEFNQEEYISIILNEYLEILKQTTFATNSNKASVASFHSNQVVTSNLTTTGGKLDDIVGATVTYAGEGPDADDPNGGDYVYPRQTLGNDYAQIVIVPHKDIRIVNRNLQPFSATCAFSSHEQLNRPSILWDSDLCVQLDGLIFASVAVFKPGLRGVNENYQPHTGSSDQVRRHAVPQFLDTNHIWGQGGYYLKDDKGRALCNMETCYVEIITSGYGAGYKVNLLNSQKALVNTLRVRMWLEGIVPAMLHIVGLSTGSDSVGAVVGAETCIYKEALKSGELYTELGKLDNRIQANKHKSGVELIRAISDALDETLGKWARKFVKSELGPAFFDCIKIAVDPEKLIGDQLSAIINSNLMLAQGLFKFADILALVSDLGSAILTPEKIVFRMDPRTRIVGVEPRVLDIYDFGVNNLDILGSWIAEKPCSPDGWCPDLIFKDKFGNEFSYPIKDSNIVPAPTGTGSAYRQISIPLANLENDLQKLSSGPLEMKLAINGQSAYSTYVDPKFGPNSYYKLPVPLPSGAINLKTKAKLFAFNPPLVKPNETVTLLGSHLDIYGDAPIFELNDLNNSFAYILQRINSHNTGEQFELKIPAAASGQYRVTIRPDPALGNVNLPPLISESTLLISSQTTLPGVIVGVLSSIKDDSLIIELLDFQGNPVKSTENLASLRFVIPTELREPKGRYLDQLYWDDSNPPSSGITADIEQIRVTCSDPGSDNTCSYGIRMVRDALCTQDLIEPKTSFYADKISKDDSRLYYVALKADQITNCANVMP